MKSSTNNFIISLLGMNILILLYFVFFSYNPTANMCLNDPLVYGYNQLQSQNNDKLYCQCTLDSDYPSPVLYFDSEGRRFEKPIVQEEDNSPYFSINLSLSK